MYTLTYLAQSYKLYTNVVKSWLVDGSRRILIKRLIPRVAS